MRMGRPLIPAEADIPTHIWEWRNGCLRIDTHSNSAIVSARICEYISAGQDREGKKITRTHTTRYETLLSVVLALALTAAVAACGSDEPSGVTGPDRTASTPVSGDAPTATDAAATAPPAASGSVETDREALVALYNATDGENWGGGDNWNESNNWLSDAPLDEWYGVITNDDGRVKELRFYGNNLTGEIPPELGSLSNLESLKLSNNGGGLSGEIPPELGSLSNLKSLQLHYNGLSGEIPAELGSLSNLTELSLIYNALSGEIPPELGSLSNLKRLHLYDNRLSGEIPAELGSLSNLTYLNLGNNGLSGELPTELGSLSNLVTLDLQSNRLSGELPAELGSLSNLRDLELKWNNDLSGCVPSSLEAHLASWSDLGGLPYC